MDNGQHADGFNDATDVDAELQVIGLSVRADHSLHIGSLRYFDAAGTFAADLAGIIGGPMPEPLRAVRVVDEDKSEILLAWRSPTESLLLCSTLEQFAEIETRTADRADGCLIDQTGGIWAWRVTGERAPDLLTRLGPVAAIPALGEARTSRLAELTVMALCVQPGEIMLLVERVYSPHLMAWIRETMADFRVKAIADFEGG